MGSNAHFGCPWMSTLEKINTSILCILCTLIPQIIPLLTLTFAHMWYEDSIPWALDAIVYILFWSSIAHFIVFLFFLNTKECAKWNPTVGRSLHCKVEQSCVNTLHVINPTFYIKHHQNGSNYYQLFFKSRYTWYLLHSK